MTRRADHGFTVIEAVMVLLIVAVILGALTPSVQRQLTRARINRAANMVAADFFLAQSLAGRQRVPVSVTFSSSAKTTVITDSRSSSTVFLTRYFGLEGDFKLQSFSASPGSILVMPNGMASQTVTVSLSDGTYTRLVRMSRAGQIRIT